jgi:hypothetical protein
MRRITMAPAFLHPVSASFFDREPARSGGILASIRAFLHRLGEAVTASRRAQAEREVARFIENQGGRLTDEVEREISRRFGSPTL